MAFWKRPWHDCKNFINHDLYDAMGNRITKIVKPAGSTSLDWVYTHYVRDAQGNVMATYKKENINQTTSYQLTERHIYGSSRVGIDNKAIELIGYTAPSDDLYRHQIGLKNYELTNHLGNVNAVLTDRKIPRSTNGLNIDYYMPDIVSATDYYAFGAIMPGRNYNAGSYRYSFSGKEQDNEIKGTGNSIDLGDRMYDPRIGRTSSMDKYSYKFPGESPYSYAMNTPLCAVDPDGKLVIFIGGLRLSKRDKDQVGSGKSGGKTGIYNSDVFGDKPGEGYWHTQRNSFGQAENIAAKFMDRIGDNNAWFTSGSSRWRSQAAARKKEGIAKAEQFHAMVQNGEIKLEKDETIKIVSHSQGGAHAEGFAEQLMSYKDADGNPLYKIEVIYNITPHQPKDINAIPGVRNVQYSHPSDAVSSDDPGWLLNGKSDFGKINGVDEFDGRDVMGGEGQPKAGGPAGNRAGHNVTDNGFIFDIPQGQPGYVAPRQDTPKN